MSAVSKLETPQRTILPSRAQPLERVDGFGQRDAAAPMQQIEIEPIGPSRFRLRSQAAIALLRAGVVRIHLAHDENVVAAARRSLRATTSSAPPSPYISAVSTSVMPSVEAQREAPPLRRSARARSLAHPPRAEAERRHGRAVGKRDVGDRRGVDGAVMASKNSRTAARPLACAIGAGATRRTIATCAWIRSMPMPLTPCHATRRARRLPARLPRYLRDARHRRGRPRDRRSAAPPIIRRPAARCARKSRATSTARIRPTACCIR